MHPISYFALLILILSQIHDTYSLVAIIDNDYIDSSLYTLFKDMIAASDKKTPIKLTIPFK